MTSTPVDRSATIFVCGYLGPAGEPAIAPLIALFAGPQDRLITQELPRQNLEKRILESTLDEAVDACVDQVLVDASGVFLAGQSLGGTVALLAGAQLAERGFVGVRGIICFSPILSPRFWYRSENYDFLDDPAQAPSEHTMIKVHRNGRYSLIARRFWDSIQRNEMDGSLEWMFWLARAETPVLIFLGQRDRMWNEPILARIRQGIPQADVRLESQSSHHFRAAASEHVGRQVNQWRAQLALATPSTARN